MWGVRVGVVRYWFSVLEDVCSCLSDLNTFVAELYMRIDDLLLANPCWVFECLVVGIAPKLLDVKADHIGSGTDTAEV